MGGMMTLIGTPPNLVIQNTLTSAGFEPLSFFTFLPVGLVSVAVGTLVLMPLSKWFLSKKGQKDDNSRSGKSLKQLVNEYGLSSNLFSMQVIKDSRLLGKTFAAPFSEDYYSETCRTGYYAGSGRYSVCDGRI